MKGFSFAFRVFNIVLACVQNMTLGGILFGWASISGGLLASPTSEGGAGLSPDYIQMMFVIAAFFSFLGPLSLGIILDYYGPRICSLTSITLITIGCFLFGFSDATHRPYFIPALCMIALGGPGAQSAIIHLSNLFPSWKATTTAVITGSFQLSFIVFLIFDQLWLWKNVSYSTLFYGYTVICLLNGVISFFLWPDEPYTFEEQLADIEEEDGGIDEEITIGHIRMPSVFIHHTNQKPGSQLKPMNIKSTNNNNTNTNNGSNPRLSKDSLRDLNNASPSKLPTTLALKDGSLLDQVKSAEFLRLVGFFLINSFWVNFYIGSFDVQIGDENLLDPSEKLNYARLFTLTITLGVIVIPIVGTIMDRFDFPIASAITTFFGLLWATFLIAETKFSLLISFICYSIFRTFLFTLVFAYLADTLGFKYFGVLAGIMFVLGGILSLLQVPLVEYASGTCHITSSATAAIPCEAGSWKILNIVMGLMIGCTFYFSYQDYLTREENKVLNEIATNRQKQFVNVLRIEDEDHPSLTTTHAVIQNYRPSGILSNKDYVASSNKNKQRSNVVQKEDEQQSLLDNHSNNHQSKSSYGTVTGRYK